MPQTASRTPPWTLAHTAVSQQWTLQGSLDPAVAGAAVATAVGAVGRLDVLPPEPAPVTCGGSQLGVGVPRCEADHSEPLGTASVAFVGPLGLGRRGGDNIFRLFQPLRL